MKITIDTDQKTVEIPGMVSYNDLAEMVKKFGLEEYTIISSKNHTLTFPPGVRDINDWKKFTPYNPTIEDIPKKQEFWYGNITQSTNTKFLKGSKRELIQG